MTLEIHKDLNKYFREQLDSLKIQPEVPWMVNPYVAEILTRYSLSSNFFINKDNKQHNPYLFEMMIEISNESDLISKKQKIKDLAEISLFYSMVFQKKIKSSLCSLDYYISTSENAYSELYNLNQEILLFNIIKNNLRLVVQNSQKMFFY